MIAGLNLPDEGNIYLDGEDITGKPGQVSYMLQKDLLLPYRTIVDNVALPLIIRGMKKKEARAKAMSYFCVPYIRCCYRNYILHHPVLYDTFRQPGDRQVV